ncbi:HAMP domain-containing sensor histidine kinase [Pedobacter gandavensis]|uniref:sensor histidine kinase n=1 Tax=Pedobacter gandavensis TaxID=2679963 RepID=UPI00292D1413|nr:HAMP domain-containing sensor histidine kinase [Pedobacter gandavensis]
MSIAGKIRFLLLILGACCIGTALSLKNTIGKKDLLTHEAAELQENLSDKESIVYDFLSDPARVEQAKQFDLNEKYALDFINLYPPQGINLLVYEKNNLEFWSSFSAFPSSLESIAEGSSFIQLPNGWYEVIRKTTGNFALVFLIEVIDQYNIQNQYLHNDLSPHLLPSNSLSLATFADTDVYGINNFDGRLLFEVKLKPGYTKSIYSKIEVWLWVIGLFSICLFVNSFCVWMVKKGRLLSATLLLSLFFAVLRITDLEYGWFNQQFDLLIFSPTIYAESFFLPSLGDFLLNVFAITWLVYFIYKHRNEYHLPNWLNHNKIAGWVFYLILLAFFGALALITDQVFFGLIINSKINFDITNIINLGWVSWVSIVILCLVWFNIYLIITVLLELSKSLEVTNKERLILFLVAFFCYLAYRLSTDFSIFFVVYALFILIVGWNVFLKDNKFSIGIFTAIFFCLAFMSSIKYLKFIDIKERNKRLTIAQKLESTDDPKIISAIESLEVGIYTDNFVADYFKQPSLRRSDLLQRHINKQFLGGYLSKFEYNIYEYDSRDSSLNERGVPLSYYKKLVQAGSIKASESNFFYRVNDTFGYQNYFGIIPIFQDNHILGTLVIELKSQQYNYNSQLPDILIDRKNTSEDDYSNYSFAFYSYGRLVNQSGPYTYKLSSLDFKAEPRKPQTIRDSLGYTHVVYMPIASKTIVVSKEKVSYVSRLATLSFFFLVFIIFSVTLYALIWVLKNIDESWGGWFNINRSLMINANKILYKTRIQFSIVLSVVATLVIVGWTTYFYIRDEYRLQQEDYIQDKIRKVQFSYEKRILSTGLPATNEESIRFFNEFADVNGAYLNLFDANGNLLFTSLPRIYDFGIIGRKMGAKAYVYLNQMQRSEYINPDERIGDFSYSSAYAPIRNAMNETVAYIGLPYYANEADYQRKIGLYINTLINIYALVFVAIGILAVFLANQITSPLTFIQESIRKTKLGQKNQPIQWSRHDEIGSLIREYNKMIAALEESAAKLARSEREIAWREMAKQVAHEIKNPLTPLKLGVQLLEKSWKEKDPNFEKKFERFNKSFIEQIDSLASIASEFSNFAKMPDTKLEKLSLLPIIQQARDVFTNTQNVEIYIFNHTTIEVMILGDKDQLLRTFNNLLKNAIEAASPEARCVIKVNVMNDEENVFVEVEDNGKGIDQEQQDKIFVPNFTTKSSGTGLGLAFVKQAVENAGGTVSFKSFTDVGTTFYLSFPLS